MAFWTTTSGAVLAALAALGMAIGCSGAEFESSGQKGGSGGTGADGGTSGSAGKGGSGKGGGSKGGSAGTGQTGGTGGSDASGGTGGSKGGNGGSSGKGGTSGTAGTAGDAGTGADGGTSGSSASGGTGGSTGGTANGGSSGTTGSFPCVDGGECGSDGDTCQDSACCPCIYSCVDGAWKQGGCAPCAAPLCPLDVPADGEACSACSVPSEGCIWDQCLFDGPYVTGACVDDKWSISKDPTCGGACCQGNGDCAAHHCVNNVCKDDDARGCWDDDQCGDGEKCSGVWVCPCNADCGGYDEPGWCVPDEDDCCLDDEDCKDAGACIRGMCKAPVNNGCWADRDCIGGTCEEESVCACGMSCAQADSPGNCVYAL